MEDLRKALRGSVIESWRPLRRVYELKSVQAILTLCPIGGPSVAILVEEFSTFGVREFILLGLCGGLRDVQIGDIILAKGAVREEGLSYHYLEDEGIVYSSWAEEWSGLLASYRLKQGVVLTTDALYRETVQKLDGYRRQGVIGVDMETASLYAVSKFNGTKAISLLCVSDLLNVDSWVLGQPSYTFRQGLSRLKDVTLRLLKGEL